MAGQSQGSWKNQLKLIVKKLIYGKFESILGNRVRPLTRKYLPFVNKIFARIKYAFYSGNNVFCPNCNRYFRRFIPHGALLRDSAKCPSCGSLERQRLLLLYLKFETNLFKDTLKVLHFSPNYTIVKYLKNLSNLDYNTTDLTNPNMMFNMDITNIIFDDNSFNVILCCHVLEHIPDDKRAMEELYRVLKPNGWALLQVPLIYSLEKTIEDPKIVTKEERIKVYGHRNHVRRYGRDYFNKLRDVGFKVRVLKITKKDIINKYGLDKDEVIVYCTK